MNEKHLQAARSFRELLSAYTEAEDLINLGGYVRGANPLVDRAIQMIDEINDFLKQGIFEHNDLPAIREKLISMVLPNEGEAKAPLAGRQAPAFAGSGR